MGNPIPLSNTTSEFATYFPAVATKATYTDGWYPDLITRHITEALKHSISSGRDGISVKMLLLTMHIPSIILTYIFSQLL